ncbi:MAG: enolase C-terminal domain-like protein, partial [Armatimonadota bacterium]
MTIRSVRTSDRRFPLADGAGADAIHRDPVYAFACAEIVADDGTVGTGFALTLGEGNDLVCRVIEGLAEDLPGAEVEELMARFGEVCRGWADHPRWRWLGPHKGVVHLALAALSNACFDLWAKSRAVPLWRLLLDLTPEALVAACDFSYCEDVLPSGKAVEILRRESTGRAARDSVLSAGFPAYDTSAGWFSYDDARIEDNVRRAMDAGFPAVKLKVGSRDPVRDVRRAERVRSVAGDALQILLDVNQQWAPEVAVERALELSVVDPVWIEEPTHPDDIAAHRRIAEAISPIKVAAGEHLPNRVVFKNY